MMHGQKNIKLSVLVSWYAGFKQRCS